MCAELLLTLRVKQGQNKLYRPVFSVLTLCSSRLLKIWAMKPCWQEPVCWYCLPLWVGLFNWYSPHSISQLHCSLLCSFMTFWFVLSPQFVFRLNIFTSKFPNLILIHAVFQLLIGTGGDCANKHSLLTMCNKLWHHFTQTITVIRLLTAAENLAKLSFLGCYLHEFA